MPLIPLGDKILVRAESEMEKKTQSGIIFNDTNPYKKGVVVAVSESITDIKAGDVILFEKNTGVELQDGDDVVLAIPHRSVSMIVKK